MKYTDKNILEKLRSYSDMARKVKQLEYELEHYTDKITGDDVIETMTQKSGFGDNISGGQTSDKTADIALSYAEIAERMNLRDKRELLIELKQVEIEINRLAHYVSLLDGEQADVLRIRYFEGKTITKVAESLGFSETSVKHIIKVAVSTLTEMYNFVAS